MQQQMQQLLAELYDKQDRLGDDDDLDEYDRGVLETLQWILEKADKPVLQTA